MFEPWNYDQVYAKYWKLYKILVRTDLKKLKRLKIILDRIVQGTYNKFDVTDHDLFSS